MTERNSGELFPVKEGESYLSACGCIDHISFGKIYPIYANKWAHFVPRESDDIKACKK